MVQSLNTKVDLTVKATSYLGLANSIMKKILEIIFKFHGKKLIV